MVESYICLLLLAGTSGIISITSIVETILVKDIENSNSLISILYISYIMFSLATFIFTGFAYILYKEHLDRLLVISRQSPELANEVINALA